MKLTAQEIAKHEPRDAADYIVFDEILAGFGLRYRDGRRTWVYQYAFGSGETRTNARMTLGEYPALPAAKARSLAEDLYAKVRLGHHPAKEKRENRVAAGDTFGRLVASYLHAKHNEFKDKTRSDITRYLDVYAKPLHGLPISGVDLKPIASLLGAITREAGAVSSNRARSALSAMFVWAMRKGLVGSNPVVATEKLKEKSRDRVLTDAELAAVWNAAAGSYGDIVKLLALTGQRAAEIGNLRWDEIDFDKKLISLPAERTKNGRPHEVPLSDAAIAILKQQRAPNREFVFGRRDGGFFGWGQCKAALDKKLNLKPWRIHDLRRTCATGMGELGTQPHVIEAVLNHVSGQRAGIAGIYNRALYKAEKAQALAKWATHVLAVAEGKKSNVTAFKRA
jgi:integrase